MKKETTSKGSIKKGTSKKEIVEEKSLDSSSGEELSEASSSSEFSDSENSEDSEDSQDSQSETEEALPKRKKAKTDDGSTDFSAAMNAILDSKLKAHDRSDPIMKRSRKQTKQLASDKLEAKAKRALTAERKAKLNRNRVKDLLPTDDSTARDVLMKEKKLRKVAQRGVIKLFNAILMTQTKTSQELNDSTLIGATKKEQLMNEISKEKFLDLVQAAGKH